MDNIKERIERELKFNYFGDMKKKAKTLLKDCDGYVEIRMGAGFDMIINNEDILYGLLLGEKRGLEFALHVIYNEEFKSKSPIYNKELRKDDDIYG
jgi:hypothetical protein